MPMFEDSINIDESKVSFTSPTDFIVSVFRNHDPQKMDMDDYYHMKLILKKLWNEEKNTRKLRKAHLSYWELFKNKNKGLSDII